MTAGFSASRPPSQLSHQASSGYGSTRSRRDANLLSTKTDKSKDETSTKDDSRIFKRHNKPNTYNSMKYKNKNSTKNSLSKTASYFSMRLPGSSRLSFKAKKTDKKSSDSQKSKPNSDNDSKINQNNNDSKNNIPIHFPKPDLVTSESRHTVSSQYNKSGYTVESNQTSKIILHHNNSESTSNISNFDHNLNNTYVSNEDQVNYPWSNHSQENINGHLDCDPFSNPVPAPRNGNGKTKHTYQNLPLPAKENNYKRNQHVVEAWPEVGFCLFVFCL